MSVTNNEINVENNDAVNSVNSVDTNKTDSKTNEEIRKVEEDTFNLALGRFKSYNLAWTFRSINFVLNKEQVSFSQLRSCVYIKDGQAVFDYIRSVIILIKAGLIGSKQMSESDDQALEDRAYDIIEDWRQSFGFIGTLHLFIINRMEETHFFMGQADRAVLNHLSYKNMQRDLVRSLELEDLEQKMNQAKALSGV